MLVPREGFEPTLDRLSTCCLCRWATSAGAAPRIRTGTLSLLKRAPLPGWASAAVKTQKPPRHRGRGAFVVLRCRSLRLHVDPPGLGQRKQTEGQGIASHRAAI